MGSVVILVRFILFFLFFASNFFRVIWVWNSGFEIKIRIWVSGFGFKKFLSFCFIIGLRDVTGQNDI